MCIFFTDKLTKGVCYLVKIWPKNQGFLYKFKTLKYIGLCLFYCSPFALLGLKFQSWLSVTFGTKILLIILNVIFVLCWGHIFSHIFFWHQVPVHWQYAVVGLLIYVKYCASQWCYKDLASQGLPLFLQWNFIMPHFLTDL